MVVVVVVVVVLVVVVVVLFVPQSEGVSTMRQVEWSAEAPRLYLDSSHDFMCTRAKQKSPCGPPDY